MNRIYPFLAGLLVVGAVVAQDDDPFAGGEDTAVGEAPAAVAPGDPADPAAAAGPDGAAPAPLPPPDPSLAGDSMVFHEDLKQFEFDVTVNAYKAVNETLNAAAFAKSKGAKGAIYPPVSTPQQVEASIEQEVQRRVQIEFPDTRYDEIKNEAAEAYKMWKVGDRIKVMARRGDKMVPFVGPLEFVARTRIKISTFPIYKQDIGKEYLPLLYRVEHERAVQRQVSRETRIFNEKRQEYGDQQRKELTAQSWYRAGYIRGRNNTWLPRSEVFETLYAKARKQEFEKVFKANREKVYLDNGWIFDPTLNRWLSPSDQLPPEPVATADPVAPADGGGEKPAAGGIFGALENLINKEGAPEKEPEGDLWDDEPEKKDPGAAKAAGDPPADAPDDSDLFGEE